MSARKDLIKQSKQKDKENMKSLIQNVKNYWPDLMINEELLRNPSTGFVKAFYGRFYCEFEKVTAHIRTNIFEQEVCKEQNIYDDEFKLAIEMKKLCGYSFNINDIYEPQPTRTIFYFTVLMNVLIFIKTKTEYIDDIAECVQEDKDLKQLKLSKDALLEEIQHSNELDIQLGSDINDLNHDIENLSQKYKDTLQQKAKNDFKYQQNYKVIEEMKRDIITSKESLTFRRMEFTNLQEQIVNENEVDSLKNEINDLEKKLENLDINRIKLTSDLEDLKDDKYYRKCLVSIENPVFNSNSLEKLKTDIEKLTAFRQKANKLGEQITLKRAELKRLREEYENLDKNLQKLTKVLEETNVESKKKMEIIGHGMNNLVSKIQKDKDLFRSYENENKNFEEIISLLKNDIASVESSFVAKVDAFNEKQEKVYERFNGLLNIHQTLSNPENRNIH